MTKRTDSPKPPKTGRRLTDRVKLTPARGGEPGDEVLKVVSLFEGEGHTAWGPEHTVTIYGKDGDSPGSVILKLSLRLPCDEYLGEQVTKSEGEVGGRDRRARPAS